VPQSHVRCPDCLDNELSPPSPYDPGAPKGRSTDALRPKGTLKGSRPLKKTPPRRCDTCGGWGWVPARGIELIDPYLRGRA